jgi:hypothetical protein
MRQQGLLNSGFEGIAGLPSAADAEAEAVPPPEGAGFFILKVKRPLTGHSPAIRAH